MLKEIYIPGSKINKGIFAVIVLLTFIETFARILTVALSSHIPLKQDTFFFSVVPFNIPETFAVLLNCPLFSNS